MKKSTFIAVLFCTFIIFLCSKGMPLRRSSKAASYFLPAKSVKWVKTRLECVAAFWANFNPENGKNQSVAFKFNVESKNCYLGGLGPMPGDFDLLDPKDDFDPNPKKQIHFLSNCLASTTDLGSEILFFMSYLDNNPKGLGIYKTKENNIDRIKGENYEPSHDFSGGMSNNYVKEIPFKLPISGKLPSEFYGLDNKATIKFDLGETFTLASLSIFSWTLLPSFDANDNIIKFYEDGQSKSFFGFSIDSGRSKLSRSDAKWAFRLGKTNRHRVREWIYVGLTLNMTSGYYKIFENENLLQEGHRSELENLDTKIIRFIVLGPNQNHRATLEVHSHAMSSEQVVLQNQKAFHFMEDTCEKGRNALQPVVVDSDYKIKTEL